MAEHLTVVLCGLATYLYPHTVLCKGLAAQLVFASEAQVRERGSPRSPCLPLTI